jgi:diaminopimelate epimerase
MNFAFTKYHALGNDYIVINPPICPRRSPRSRSKPSATAISASARTAFCSGRCRRKTRLCALKIYNPDGSVAEKSGNGLRIFSRYLWDTKRVGNEEFAIQTDGGLVRSTVFDGGKMVRVEMGRVSFWSDKIPVAGPRAKSSTKKFPSADANSPLRRDHRQSALRPAAAGNQRGAGAPIRPAAGDASEFSEPDQRAVPESPRPREHPD